MKGLPAVALFLALLIQPAQANGDLVWERPGWNGLIEKAAISGDAMRVAASMQDGRVVIRDVEDGSVVFVHSCAPYAASAIAISQDGLRVAWGDYDGLLYTWSETSGLVSRRIGNSAISAVSISGDGTRIMAASDGVNLEVVSGNTLQMIEATSLSLEQVHAAATNEAGDIVLVGDQSGNVRLLIRTAPAVSRVARISQSGIRGAAIVSESPLELVVWDELNSVYFLNQYLYVLGEVSVPGSEIRCAAFDRNNGLMTFGDNQGHLRQIDLKTHSLTAFHGASDYGCRAIASLDNGGWLLLDKAGRYRHFSGSGSMQTPPSVFYQADPFPGPVTRSSVSLQSGKSFLITDWWNSTVSYCQLADHSSGMTGFPDATHILDIGQRMVTGGSQKMLLYLDGDVLHLNAGFISDFSITGWTPTRLANSMWTNKFALLDADGTISVQRIQAGEVIEEVRIEGGGETFWTDLEFFDEDRVILKWGRGMARLHAIDQATPDTTWMLATELVPQAIVYNAFDGSLLYANEAGTVFRIAVGNTESETLLASTGDQVLALQVNNFGRELKIWKTSAVIRLDLLSGAILESAPIESPLTAVYPAGDGPYAMAVAENGAIQLRRTPESPLFAAFPNLVPSPDGGMKSGFLGNLSLYRSPYIVQREFGWAYLAPSAGVNWYWFTNEGWLAGNSVYGPFLYSNSSQNWLYTLVNTWPTKWVYDYSTANWRLFHN